MVDMPEGLPKMRRSGASAPAAPAASEPRAGGMTFLCPFSGRPLEFRVCGPDMMVMVISPHGWSSKLFQTVEQAKEWASFLDGRQRYSRPRIEVRQIEEPEGSPADGLIVSPDDVTDADLPPSLRKG